MSRTTDTIEGGILELVGPQEGEDDPVESLTGAEIPEPNSGDSAVEEVTESTAEEILENTSNTSEVVPEHKIANTIGSEMDNEVEAEKKSKDKDKQKKADKKRKRKELAEEAKRVYREGISVEAALNDPREKCFGFLSGIYYKFRINCYSATWLAVIFLFIAKAIFISVCLVMKSTKLKFSYVPYAGYMTVLLRYLYKRVKKLPQAAYPYRRVLLMFTIFAIVASLVTGIEVKFFTWRSTEYYLVL